MSAPYRSILQMTKSMHLCRASVRGNDISTRASIRPDGCLRPVSYTHLNYPVWKCLLLMVAGGVLVVKGSDFAVSGATEIARYFGMSERFIGLTIVALGTSLPELVTSVTAAKRGNAGIAIGNIVGSNIFNILFVIGTAALICPVPFETKFIVDTGIAILAGLVLWIGTYKNRELRKTCGVVMLLCYAGYFAYLCVV